MTTSIHGKEKNIDYTLLTTARFFAALWVVFFHLTVPEFSRFSHRGVLHNNLLSNYGFLGVTFFYVLSGFILATIYPKVENKKLFFEKRFLRIYPSYAIILALVVAIPLFQFPRTFAYCAPVFLLVQSWVPSTAQNVLGPAWSLSCEAFFYIAFPFVVAWILKTSRVGVVAVCALTFVATLLSFLAARFGYTFNQMIAHHWVNFPLVHLPSFLVGIVFARFKKVPKMTLPALLGCVLWIVGTRLVFQDPFPLLLGITAIPFGWLIWALAGEKQFDSKGKFGATLILLGNASYVLYLAHLPILRLFQMNGWLGSDIESIAAVFTTILFSLGFYVAIDRPIHIAGLKLLRVRTESSKGRQALTS